MGLLQRFRKALPGQGPTLRSYDLDLPRISLAPSTRGTKCEYPKGCNAGTEYPVPAHGCPWQTSVTLLPPPPGMEESVAGGTLM